MVFCENCNSSLNLEMVSITALVASWRLYAVVAAGLAGLVRASPSVNVALQASFDSAPYLLELV